LRGGSESLQSVAGYSKEERRLFDSRNMAKQAQMFIERRYTMPDKNIKVGEKIKSLRIEKGLSLEETAQQSGISATTLEDIESHKIYPPLGNIVSLAKVLGVVVGDLFGDSGDSPFSISRSGDRATVNRFDSAENKSCGYSYEGLGQHKRNRQMEPFIVTLSADDSHEIMANQHIGEEFIFVLEGQVKVNLADQTDILDKGDSIYYDSIIPHKVSCHGGKPATILAVIYAKDEMIIF
jgi:transcriptional regulator with XRE-family HTH domain